MLHLVVLEEFESVTDEEIQLGMGESRGHGGKESERIGMKNSNQQNKKKQ